MVGTWIQIFLADPHEGNSTPLDPISAPSTWVFFPTGCRLLQTGPRLLSPSNPQRFPSRPDTSRSTRLLYRTQSQLYSPDEAILTGGVGFERGLGQKRNFLLQ